MLRYILCPKFLRLHVDETLIFSLDYGEQYLDTRGGYADSVPRKDDFIEAGTILTAIKESSLKSAAVINGMFCVSSRISLKFGYKLVSNG